MLHLNENIKPAGSSKYSMWLEVCGPDPGAQFAEGYIFYIHVQVQSNKMLNSKLFISFYLH